MIIYLANLSHTGAGRSPNAVPLAAGYLAAAARKHFADIEITIFRDPGQLLDTVRLRRPDMVGFSVYGWSESLSAFCAQRIKEASKKTVIAAGGPSIDDTDAELLRYLRLHPHYDLCVPDEGEAAFIRLIEHLKKYGGLLPNQLIEGCARLSTGNSLIRGRYIAPELSDIPSPYLEGLLDVFLDDGYDPVISSMRGCPYSCKFCVCGTKTAKIRAFELERVIAEIDYIKKRSKSKFLVLTDDNFGILKERDIKLAEHIIKSFKGSGFPCRIQFSTAKIITDEVLRIVEILSPIGEFGMSFQTLSETVQKEIGRTNIKYSDFLKNVQWAKRKKIITSTEMIFGFPGETAQSFIDGLERLLRSGVDRIRAYNLRLLPGTDLYRQASRDKYKLRTMYRLMDRTFGRYDGSAVGAMEEIVVGCDSFGYEDYQKVRKYGLFLELASAQGYLSEMIQLMLRLGLPGEKLLAFFAEHNFSRYPRLFSIVNDYLRRAREELFQTPEMYAEYVYKTISNGKLLPEVKLNFIYTGKIMLDPGARSEFFAAAKEFIRLHSAAGREADFLERYVDEILAGQIVDFSANQKNPLRAESRVRFDKIERNDYSSVGDLLAERQFPLELLLHRDAVDFMREKALESIDDEKTIQDIYMTVSKFGLLRLRKNLNENY